MYVHICVYRERYLYYGERELQMYIRQERPTDTHAHMHSYIYVSHTDTHLRWLPRARGASSERCPHTPPAHHTRTRACTESARRQCWCTLPAIHTCACMCVCMCVCMCGYGCDTRSCHGNKDACISTHTHTHTERERERERG
jgi:hypothetical protein